MLKYFNLDVFYLLFFIVSNTEKINKTYNYFEVIKRKIEIKIPIIHFTDVKPPIVICMKLVSK